MVEEKRSSGLRFPASLRHLPGKRTASVGYPRVAYPAVVTFVGQVAGCAGIDVAGIVLIHGSACFISGRTGPKKGGVEQEKSLYRSKRCFRESGPTEERGGINPCVTKTGFVITRVALCLQRFSRGSISRQAEKAADELLEKRRQAASLGTHFRCFQNGG
jgi:hypothetical protein